MAARLTLTRTSWLLVWLVYTGIVHAQNIRSVSSGPQRTMRVVEVGPQRAGSPNYLTIAGAVRRSGVYLTDEPRVPLDELIRAAGGLAETSTPSIRIVRNGRLVQQIFYFPSSKVEVTPGDIAIVVPQGDSIAATSGSRIIPVVCLGLLDRPVVLPLEPEVASLPILVQRLLQADDLAETSVVVDPLGKVGRTKLLPGSVISFDTSRVNRAAMQTTQPFPPAVRIDAPLTPTSADAETVAAIIPDRIPDSDDEQAPIVIPNDDQAQAGIESATALPIDDQIPLQLPKIQPGTTLDSESGDDGIEGSTVPDGGFSLPVPEDLRHSAPASRSASPSPDHAEADADTPTPTLAIGLFEEFDDLETPDLDADISAAAEDAEAANSAPLPPISSDDVTPAQQIDSTPSADYSSWLPVIAGIGVMAFVFLGISLVWSSWDRKQQRALQPPVHAATPSTEPLADVADSEVKQILDRTLPIIEEQVLLAVDTEIHGAPVAHRRLILHEQHPAPIGPHSNPLPGQPPFAPARQQTEDAESRSLDSELGTVSTAFAETEATDPESSLGDRPEVEPQPAETAPENRQAARVLEPGALERALRSLAEESQT